MISIGTTFNYDIALKDQLPMIKEAGFTHISLGARIEHSGYLAVNGRKNIRRFLVGNGLSVCSVHTPFGKDLDISSPRRDISDTTVDTYKRCIDAAADLSAHVVIFHPTAYLSSDHIEMRKESLVKSVEKLLDHVGGTTVRLAVENDSFGPANDVLVHSLDEIEDTRYGFCYDSSHDNLVEKPLVLLRKCRKRLLTTHISDNHGEKDDHMLPFEGSYDWDGFCEIMSRVSFEGVLLLEVETRESAFGSPEKFLHEAFTRGEKLRKACRK